MIQCEENGKNQPWLYQDTTPKIVEKSEKNHVTFER
jgi:hypothetical protein